jgi:hypothetical protein
MEKRYELWEIMKDGKNNEVFEVVSCNLSSYIGTQIKVQVKEELWESYKCLVKADADGDGEEALATLYGCLGTAKYKKVQQFTEIKLSEALQMLEDYRVVYISNAGEKVELSRYTSMESLYISDFSDLMNKKFYKKG